MAFNGNPSDDLKPRMSGWKIAMLVGLCTAIFGLVGQQAYDKFSTYMHTNPAYIEGVAILKSNGAAKAILGDPIMVGAMLSGNVRTRNNTGDAAYILAVSGSECAGTLHLRAHFQNNCWALTQWVLESECSEAPLVLRNGDGLHSSDNSAQEA